MLASKKFQLIYFSLSFVALFSISYSNTQSELAVLTAGEQTRIVWVNGGDRLYGGGSIKGYDSKTDAITEILPADYYQNKPILCSGGNRVIVSTNYKVSVVNWEGTGVRYITDGICSDAWKDPSTGREWIFVRKGRDTTSGAIYRYTIDSPIDSQLIWDASPAGDFYSNWWQVSADGTMAVDFLPWNRCFTVQNGAISPNGLRTGFGRGCWSTVEHDNSYISAHFTDDKGHSVLRIYRKLDLLGDILINAAPLADTSQPHEFFHPRFATKGGRCVVLTGGYDYEGTNKQVEIYFGKISSDYKSFEGWVRVTSDSTGDFYPDAWVGVEPPAPSILLSKGELTFKAATTDNVINTQPVAVTTASGILTNVTATTPASWLHVSITGSGSLWQITNSIDSHLESGLYTTTVTVASDSSTPKTISYTVKAVITGMPVASTITIDPQYPIFPTGTLQQFTAHVLDQSDSVMITHAPIKWSIRGGTTKTKIDSTGILTTGDSASVCTVFVACDTLLASTRATIITPLSKPIKILAPRTGTTFTVGQSTQVVSTCASSILNILIKVSPDSGKHWCAITTSPLSKWLNSFKNFPWRIEETMVNEDGVAMLLVSNKVMLVVQDAIDSSVKDIVGPITIRRPIRITQPLDKPYQIGDTMAIEWIADNTSAVVLSGSVDNGKTWHVLPDSTIRLGTASWGHFKWVIPPTTLDMVPLANTDILIRVASYTNESLRDITQKATHLSPNSISVVTDSPIVIHSPDIASRYCIGDTMSFSWVIKSTITTMKLQVTSDSGTTWQTLSDTAAKATAFKWGVPFTLASMSLSEQPIQFRLNSLDTNYAYSSFFTVHAYPITITNPDSISTYFTNDTISVSWYADTSRIDEISIAISTDSMRTWVTLTDSINTFIKDTFSFVLGDSVGSSMNCFLRATSADTMYSDTSSQFTIQTLSNKIETPSDSRKCGCGTGTGLALLPPLWFKVRGSVRRKRRLANKSTKRVVD